MLYSNKNDDNFLSNTYIVGGPQQLNCARIVFPKICSECSYKTKSFHDQLIINMNAVIYLG